MKNKRKTNYLLGILLSVFIIVGIINVTNGAKTVIDTNPDSSKLHTPSLFSLFLGSDSNNYAQISVNTGGSTLDILNGLIVGKNHTVNGSPKLSVIGGGYKNTIKGNNAGIGGGEENRIHFDNGVIGGGKKNLVEGPNGIVVGGLENKAKNYGIVLGGYKNQSDYYGIILGGSGNEAFRNSLVLGSNAYGKSYSFAWNGYAPANSARIDATGGMLIGTYNPVTGVSLVVSGAIKLGEEPYNLDINGDGKFDKKDHDYLYENCFNGEDDTDFQNTNCDVDGILGFDHRDQVYINSHNLNSNYRNFNTGSIASNLNGCIQFYDGHTYNTLGKVSEDSGKCGINTGCQFGVATLHNGDIVTAYSVSYTGDCQNASGKAICENGQMVDLENHQSHVFVYPYCYNLSDDPVITVTEGYQQCHEGLPEHAVWTNSYFTQRLEGNTYTSQPQAEYNPEGTQECSYKCTGGYEYKEGSGCIAKCTGGEEPASNDTNIVTSTISPSEPTQWTYVEDYNTLAACQWTCTGDYVRASTTTGDPLNYCIRQIQPNACPSQENISFPDGLCTAGELNNLGIGIPYNRANVVQGRWNCGSNTCTGYLPTAVFIQEKTDNGLKVYINKYRNGNKVSWNFDSVNFQGVILPVFKYTDGGEFTINIDNPDLTCHIYDENGECVTNNLNNLACYTLDENGYYVLKEECASMGIGEEITLLITNKIAETGTVIYPNNNQNYTFNGRNSLGYATPTRDSHGIIIPNKYDYKSPDIKYGNTCRSVARDSFLGFIPGQKYQFIKNEACDGTGNIRAKDGYILLYGGISGLNIHEPEEPSEGVAYLKQGGSINTSMIGLVGSKDNITSFKKYDGNIPSNVTTKENISESGVPVYIWYDNGTIYYHSDATKIYMNPDSQSIFSGFTKITSISGLSNWDASKVKNMNSMFKDCKKLTSLDISNWNTSKVQKMVSVFQNCQSITELDLSKWKTSNVDDMHNMFNMDDGSCTPNCSKLKTLNVSTWITNNVTDMSFMFNHTDHLQNIDISGWNTSKVENMNLMFHWGLRNENKVLDLRKWNVSNVKSMDAMFGRTNLKELNISGWNTSKINDMSSLFYHSSIDNLNAANLKTQNVTDMAEMFYKAGGLENINVSGWNTSKVENMNGMFQEAYGLTELDLSSWNTSSVTNIANMFNGCPNLKTIYTSENFKTNSVTSGYDMFTNSTEIEGGQGTTYSSSHVDKEYARIDCRPSKPGYFSRKDGDYSSCGGTTYSCQGTLPEHATLRNSTTPTNNSTKYEHSSTSTNIACKFHCDDKYRWDSSNKKCKETCTVTFVANGGTFSDRDVANSSNSESTNSTIKVVYDCGHSIVPNYGERIPTPFIYGQCFKGRYTDRIGGTFLGNGSVINSDITVHAQWGTGLGSFSLNPNGGTIEYYNRYRNNLIYYSGNNYLTVQDVCNDKIEFGYLRGPNGEILKNWETTCRDVGSSTFREIYTISSPYSQCTIRAIWN